MPWHRNDGTETLGTDGTITFECDTCDVVIDCDIVTVRETAKPAPTLSDFAMCFNYVQGLGWRSFKRTGRAWSYHCLACSPQAEIEHRDHQQHDNDRDRIRSRNSRDGG